MVERPLRSHSIGPLANHDAKLRFVIDAANVRGQANRIVRTNNGRARLHEHQRLGRQRLVPLCRVVFVIEADAQNLRRQNRRQNGGRLDRGAGAIWQSTINITIDQAIDAVAFNGVGRRAVVFNAKQSSHGMTTVWRLEYSLVFGGSAASMATTT